MTVKHDFSDVDNIDEIRRLRSEVKFLKDHIANLTDAQGPLTPPSEYYIVDEANGRASAYFRMVAICSTTSRMDALRWCWMHCFGIPEPYEHNISIAWRKLESGWVWWYSTRRSKEWIASKDFTSIKDCILTAYA